RVTGLRAQDVDEVLEAATALIKLCQRRQRSLVALVDFEDLLPRLDGLELVGKLAFVKARRLGEDFFPTLPVRLKRRPLGQHLGKQRRVTARTIDTLEGNQRFLILSVEIQHHLIARLRPLIVGQTLPDARRAHTEVALKLVALTLTAVARAR